MCRNPNLQVVGSILAFSGFAATSCHIKIWGFLSDSSLLPTETYLIMCRRAKAVRVRVASSRRGDLATNICTALTRKVWWQSWHAAQAAQHVPMVCAGQKSCQPPRPPPKPPSSPPPELRLPQSWSSPLPPLDALPPATPVNPSSCSL